MDDRGLHVQALGFGIVGSISVWVLHRCSGLECQACEIVEDATTRVYWAFVPPLVWLLDWGRRMFERRQAIREEAVRQEIDKRLDLVEWSKVSSVQPDKMKEEIQKMMTKKSE
jgi:hypothetical protein